MSHVCEARCEVLLEHDVGFRQKRRQTESAPPRLNLNHQRCALVVQNGSFPPDGCGLRKMTQRMFGQRVVGEGYGRGQRPWGSGESLTARAVISRHTNVTETNQRPAFFVYFTFRKTHAPTCEEIRMYIYKKTRMCPHVRMYQRQQAFFGKHKQVALIILSNWKKQALFRWLL